MKLCSLVLSFMIVSPSFAMDTLQSAFKQFCGTINKRITTIAQKTAYKKRSITAHHVLSSTAEKISQPFVHPLHIFSALHEFQAFCDMLIKADTLKTRMRDLQYTIYIQQATVQGLKAVARNQYVLDHQIQYLVPLIQGNSKMYPAVQEASQYSLGLHYHIAQSRVAPGKTWFAAVSEVESEATQTLQENKQYYAALNTLFNHAVKQLSKYENKTQKIQTA